MLLQFHTWRKLLVAHIKFVDAPTIANKFSKSHWTDILTFLSDNSTNGNYKAQ